MNFFLKDLPDNFFQNKFSLDRFQVNNAILMVSGCFSLILGILFVFLFDFLIGFCSMFTFFFIINLLIVRKIKDVFFNQILEVERYSDLICREILLILSVTNSLPLVVEFIAQGNYPTISLEFTELLKDMNLGVPPVDLLKSFANKQPSETIKEFLLEYVFPLVKGEIKPSTNFKFNAQWRIRSNFDSYLSQIEGKMSLFLALTTIVPITSSMLLIIFGYVSINLLFFLPLIFFILGIIALEILNAGKVELLGGDNHTINY